MNAYPIYYLDDAKENLAVCFDYVVNVCHINIDSFMFMLINSKIAHKFETGDPHYVSGMSGTELANIIIKECWNKEIQKKYKPQFEKTEEYWAGYYLAEYMWKTGRTFKELFRRINLSDIVKLYNPYHEMSIDHFNKAIDKMYYSKEFETRLKQLREARGYSQSQLAKLTGINIRSIQMYEQRNNDIDKAQVNTLYKLSVALNCNIEDLLEDISQS